MTKLEQLRTEAYAAADAIIIEHGWPWSLKDGRMVEDGNRARDFLALAFVGGIGYGASVIEERLDAALAELGQELEIGGGDAAA